MTRSIAKLATFNALSADDIDLHLVDFLFDNDRWVVRYLTFRIRPESRNRAALVSVMDLNRIDSQGRVVHVKLTHSELESGLKMEADGLVSRRVECEYNLHFGYSAYWDGTGLWGNVDLPHLLARERAAEAAEDAEYEEDEGAGCHLSPMRVLFGSRVESQEGLIGTVEDVLVDEHSWRIEHLVLSAPSRSIAGELGRRKSILPARWIDEIDSSESRIRTGLSRRAVFQGGAY